MGLAVCLGVLVTGPDDDPESTEHLTEQFAEINRLLEANGLPPHTEPTSLPKRARRIGPAGFPYSWLHYLRRAVAFALQKAADKFRPVRKGADPSDDERVVNELCDTRSHLICHSDCEGFYVPIDFPDVLYHDDEDAIDGGGMVGSSQRALAEVLLAAPLLGIPLRKGKPSERTLKAIAAEPDTMPYWIERQVWLTMYQAFRDSVQTGCAVVFG
jgi:hypothetical protein